MPSDDPAAVRLHFDASRCDGLGMCSIVFPERIALDEWGYARVASEPITDRSAVRRASRAVRGCPGGALWLSGLPGRGQPTVTTGANHTDFDADPVGPLS